MNKEKEDWLRKQSENERVEYGVLLGSVYLYDGSEVVIIDRIDQKGSYDGYW